MSIEFKPLYWVYHDFWNYQSQTYVDTYDGIKTTTKNMNHLGHMHFFIPGFYTENANSFQAYSGTQTYEYNLQQLWSPNSKDPNQQFNFVILDFVLENFVKSNISQSLNLQRAIYSRANKIY